MGWRADERTRRTIGRFQKVSEQSTQATLGTAHLIELPDGRTMRVLPDSQNSGQRRSQLVSEALRAAEQLERDDTAALLVIGYLDAAGLEWEWTDLPESALSEWLAGWWHRMANAGEQQPWSRLPGDLARAGWQIIEGDTQEGDTA